MNDRGDYDVPEPGVTVILNKLAVPDNKSSSSDEPCREEHISENQEVTEAEGENSSCPSLISLCRKIEGKLSLLMAGVFSAIAFSLVKLNPTMPVGEFSSIISVFVILLILPLLFFRKHSIDFYGKSKFIVIRAFCGGIFLLFSFWSSRVMDYGDATALTSLVPIFAALSSRVMWKENVSISTLAAMIIGLSGTALVAKPTFIFGAPDEAKKEGYSSYFSLVPISGSAICGFGLSFMRKIGTDVSPLLVSIIAAFFNILGGTVFQFCYGDRYILPGCFLEKSIQFAGGLCLFITFFLVNRGLTLEKSGVGATLINCDIVVAYFIQVMFFHSVPDVTSIVGALLVLVSAVLVSMDKILSKKCRFEF